MGLYAPFFVLSKKMIWNEYVGKRVFVILKNQRKYEGEVVEIDNSSSQGLIWLVLKDRYGRHITFLHTEIEVLQEEPKN